MTYMFNIHSNSIINLIRLKDKNKKLRLTKLRGEDQCSDSRAYAPNSSVRLLLPAVLLGRFTNGRMVNKLSRMRSVSSEWYNC